MFTSPPNTEPLVSGNYAFPAPMLGGRPTGFASNPLEEIGNAVTAIIKQQCEIFEMFTGCQTRNRYHIFITNRAGVQTYLFKGKESSSCCERNCYPPGFRPYQMRLKHMSGSDKGEDFEGQCYALFDRPCKLACCCFCRPVSTGKFPESNSNFGKIIEPCVLCSPEFDIYENGEEGGKVKYKIVLDCLQIGFLLRQVWIGSCFDTNLRILDENKRQVGSILKKARGLRGLVSDADTFNITFPDSASATDKMSILGATIMIDYAFYEDDGRTCLQKCINRC